MKLLLFIAALAAHVSATTYAQFCNDYDCKEGCGESVSVDNAGCLEESGRNSVKFHGINFQDVSLLWSPKAGCNCQEHCRDFTSLGAGGPTCISLAGTPVAHSFRFIGGLCPKNNC